MRHIYLVRHGKPDFPTDERYCLGLTDMPVGAVGRLQGCLLARELGGRGLTVFSSPLSRAVETAEFISPGCAVVDDMKEMYAGDWDGLSFREIKERWPDIFRLRGEHPEVSIPGAEETAAGSRRFVSAVLDALARSQGDIAVVAHSTVDQYLICAALGTPAELGRKYRLDYGSYSVLGYDGAFHLEELNLLPRPPLDGELCMALLSAAPCDERISGHCLAVSGEALRIAGELRAAGCVLDDGLIRSSALLHDIARRERGHAAVGAAWLLELGYPAQAEIIRQHHDPDSTDISEAVVVYIADKCVSGTQRVSVARRFELSLEKCADAQALEAHKKRYETARAVMNKINAVCKKEIIQ